MNDISISGLARRVELDPLAYHVTLRLVGDRVLAPSQTARRAAARAVLVSGSAHRMLFFRLADTHLHVILAAPIKRAAAFVRSVTRRLHGALRPGVPFEPARYRRVDDQRHLMSAGQYVLGQDRRHGIAVDPLFDASNLPELVGARTRWGSSATLVGELMPRFDARELLPARATVSCWDDLHDAAAAAFCLPDITRRTNVAVQAKRAAVHVARAAVGADVVAAALGLDERSIRRLHAEPAPATHIAAVRLQLEWRAGLRLQRSSSAVAPAAPPASTSSAL